MMVSALLDCAALSVGTTPIGDTGLRLAGRRQARPSGHDHRARGTRVTDSAASAISRLHRAAHDDLPKLGPRKRADALGFGGVERHA